jgi:hypothetical protein
MTINVATKPGFPGVPATSWIRIRYIMEYFDMAESGKALVQQAAGNP